MNDGADLPGEAVSIPATRLPTAAPSLAVVPAVVASLGDAASWRYLEFFTASIRNPNTRRAYARACAAFFRWCAARGLTLAEIRPRYLTCAQLLGLPRLELFPTEKLRAQSHDESEQNGDRRGGNHR